MRPASGGAGRGASRRRARELGRIAALARARGRASQLAYLVDACRISSSLRAESVDHVHVHFGTNSVSVALLMRRLGGPGYSITVHGADEADNAPDFELTGKIAEAKFVVGVSAYTRSQLRRWSALGDWRKLHVVHCGIDDAFFESKPIDAADRRSFSASDGCGRRRASSSCSRPSPGWRPTCRRRGSCWPATARCAPCSRRGSATLGIEDRVRITGWISSPQVRDELLAARVLVQRSFPEGLPVVIMEAMALGRPVISTFVAGIPELVLPGETGWLVPAGEIEALADALRDVLAADVSLLEQKGRRGAERVRERHFLATEVDRLEQLFREACAPPR